MPFVHTYGSILDALQLASQAGAGEGFQNNFNNQMSADRIQQSAQQNDNSAIESGIQDSLAYDRLASQDAQTQAENQRASSEFAAQQNIAQQRIGLDTQHLGIDQQTANDTASYHDAEVKNQASTQASTDAYRNDQLKNASDNLDLKTKVAGLQSQADANKAALQQAQMDKVQDYGQQYLKTSMGQMDMQHLKDLQEDKLKAESALANALGEKDRAAKTDSLTNAQKAYTDQYTALQSRAAAFATQQQQAQQEAQAQRTQTIPGNVISSQPRVDPRAQAQTAQAVTQGAPVQGPRYGQPTNGGQGQTVQPPTQQTDQTPQQASGGGTQQPQEGQTATSKSGRPIVFQNGKWVYQ